jgi:6-phosphogluconolactonase
MGASHLIFLGTYTRTGISKGIYTVRLDRETGALGNPELAAETTDPAWLTFSPDKRHLYAIHASRAQGMGFSVDATTGKLTPPPAASPAGGTDPVGPPSHLAVDATGRVLLAANYHESFVATTAIRADGTLGETRIIRHEGKGTHPTRQEKPHVHSVTLSPDNRFVVVADLGLDRVFSYALDPATASLTPASPPFVTTSAGAGPRHFKFGRDGRHAYVINELDNTITVFDYDASRGALSPKQTLSTLPRDFKGQSATAEIRVHPNGRFIYGSNRGDDSIAAFNVNSQTGELTFVEAVKTGGKNPRNFALSPDGKWLVCGHQDTPLLTVFRVDEVTGRLSRNPSTANVPACVCVLFFD